MSQPSTSPPPLLSRPPSGDFWKAIANAVSEAPKVAPEDAEKKLWFEAGQMVAGRYRLRNQLAKGGMGTIWEAEDTCLGRRVAIKLLNPRFAEDDSFRERFALETRTTAALRSTNIVQVFDAGLWDDVPFIVMELLQGENLHERLSRGGPLSLAETLTIARGIGSALRDAHDFGIVHRDLKPTNVLLASIGSVQVVKLVDFGWPSSPRRRQSSPRLGSSSAPPPT